MSDAVTEMKKGHRSEDTIIKRQGLIEKKRNNKKKQLSYVHKRYYKQANTCIINRNDY